MLVNLKEILQIAEARRCAVGMFNGTGLDSVQAVIGAAEELGQPVIIAHAEVHDVFNPIDLLAPVLIDAARRARVPVCVHLDHGVSTDMVYRALRLGFTSVMIDASALPYEQNLALTRQVADVAHAMGVSVEAELGRLVTAEAGSREQTDETLDPKDFYTRPDEAKAFVAATGVDALAIAFGTSHGFYKAQPKLDFGVVRDVAAATAVPLVMHGGSGVSPEGFRSAIKAGIRKINYYSYMSKSGFEAAKAVVESGKTEYLHDVEYAAMQAMKEDVKRAIRVFAQL